MLSGPTVDFSVDEGWVSGGVGRSPGEGIWLSCGGTGTQLLFLTTFDRRVHVALCYVPDESLEGDLAVMDVFSWLVQPENLVAVPATSDGFWEHMRANPNLDVGEPAPVRMAGYDGQQATVIANIADGCFEGATFLWYSPNRWGLGAVRWSRGALHSTRRRGWRPYHRGRDDRARCSGRLLPRSR